MDATSPHGSCHASVPQAASSVSVEPPRWGQRDIRRLLVTGAMAVLRAAVRKGAPEGSWLARMLERKPRMLVAIALANKMARGLWAMIKKQQEYGDPAAA